jgi:hypothetical protein
MARQTPFVAEPIDDFSSELDGLDAPCAFGVGLEGELLIAARHQPSRTRGTKGRRDFPLSRLAEAADHTVIGRRGSATETVRIRGESISVHFVQPLPEGVLLVGARCAWRADTGAEQNAVVYDPAGAAVRRMTLGDGISDVRAESSGRIWASYFDEGIFGNFGWSHPGPPCLGAHGLVCFDSMGRPTEHFEPEKAGTEPVADVYAINLAADGDVWMYPYMDFPIVRRLAGRYRVWPLGLGGARALAVDGDRALLLGDYERPDRVRVVSLEKNKARVVAEGELAAADRTPLSHARAVGVGPTVFLQVGPRVLALMAW